MFKAVGDQQLPLLIRALNTEYNLIKKYNSAGTLTDQSNHVLTMLYEAQEEDARRKAAREGRRYFRMRFVEWLENLELS